MNDRFTAVRHRVPLRGNGRAAGPGVGAGQRAFRQRRPLRPRALGGAIHHAADPLRSLGEIVRVVRPGGLVVIGVCERTGLTWLHELLRKQGALRLGRRGCRMFIALVISIARGRKR